MNYPEDPVAIGNSIVALVNYCWKDEMESFQESYEVTIDSQDDLGQWITWCNYHEHAQDHIFYHLMVLKQAFLPLFERADNEMKPPEPMNLW
jgi:hypothetical protein